MSKATAIERAENNLPILATDVASLEEALLANIGVEGMSLRTLDVVKVPGAGSTTWEVPSLDGPESAKELRGIIIGFRDIRRYYSKSFEDTGGNTPPDCASDDCITGKGTPGCSCGNCQFAKFESARSGKGQACRQYRLFLFVLEDQAGPILIAAPPTSLKNAQQYFGRLNRVLKPFYGVITSLTLHKETQPVPHAVIDFNMHRQLSPDEQSQVKKIGQVYALALQNLQAESVVAE